MRLVWVLIASVCAGCASQSSTPAATAPIDPAKDDIVTIIEKARKQGYKVVNEDGQELLCKKSMKTGTRVKSEMLCMTPDQWQDRQDTAEQQANAIRNSTVPPKTE